jgi:hypothetical protein
MGIIPQIALFDVRAGALAELPPPSPLQLSDWIKSNIRLPEGVSALPGAIVWSVSARDRRRDQ